MYELRDYQTLASLRLRQSLAKYRKTVLCSPTGSGKTVIAGDVFSRAVKKDIKPIFLTDRVEIADKTFETFTKGFGLDAQLINAKTSTIYKADCYVAMVETFYRRAITNRFPNSIIKLLFCDEAHMKVFNKVIDLFSQAYICGLTATPISNAFNMNKIYDNIVMGETVPELIRRGYLARAIDIGNSDYLRMRVTNGEFTPKDQREAFSQYNVDDKAIKLWQMHAKNRSTIVYNIDIEHNNAMAVRFRELGVSCVTVDSKTDDEDRKNYIRDYNEGKIQMLLNVGIATKGFDSPITSCILYNRVTNSINDWYQAIGRGGRINSNKDSFVCIDTGNNKDRHGSFNDHVDWEYLFHNPETDIRDKKKTPSRLCPTCYAYVDNIYVKQCGVCSSELSLRTMLKLEDQMPEELKDRDISTMTLKELQTYGKFKGYKPGWAWFQFNNKTRKPWQR